MTTTFSMTRRLPGQTEPETRHIDLADLGPKDDRLAKQICDTPSVTAALQDAGEGSMSALLLIWVIGGRQAGAAENWRTIEPHFTAAAMNADPDFVIVANTDTAPDPKAT